MRQAFSIVVRFLTPLGLAYRRVVSRPAAFGLAALGILVAACALGAVSAASLVVRDRAVDEAVSGLPPRDRAVVVTWVGTPTGAADAWPALDRQVRKATASLGTGASVPVLLYRETRFGKTLVRLGAVDGVGQAVALDSGRTPRSCRPARCQVVAVGGAAPVSGLVVTGRGTVR